MEQYVIESFKLTKISEIVPESSQQCLDQLLELKRNLQLTRSIPLTQLLSFASVPSESDPLHRIYFEVTGQHREAILEQEGYQIYEALFQLRSVLQLSEEQFVIQFLKNQNAQQVLIEQLLEQLQVPTVQSGIDLVRVLRTKHQGELINTLITNPLSSDSFLLFSLVNRFFGQKPVTTFNQFVTEFKANLDRFQKEFDLKFANALKKCFQVMPKYNEGHRHELLLTSEKTTLIQMIKEQFEVDTEHPLEFFEYLSLIEQQIRDQSTTHCKDTFSIEEIVIQMLNTDSLRGLKNLYYYITGNTKNFETIQAGINEIQNEINNFNENHTFSCFETVHTAFQEIKVRYPEVKIDQQLQSDQQQSVVLMYLKQVQQLDALLQQLGIEMIDVVVQKQDIDNHQPLQLFQEFIMKLNNALSILNPLTKAKSLLDSLHNYQQIMTNRLYECLITRDPSQKQFKHIIHELKKLEANFKSNTDNIGQQLVQDYLFLNPKLSEQFKAISDKQIQPVFKSKYTQLCEKLFNCYILPTDLFGFQQELVQKAIESKVSTTSSLLSSLHFALFGEIHDFDSYKQFVQIFNDQFKLPPLIQLLKTYNNFGFDFVQKPLLLPTDLYNHFTSVNKQLKLNFCENALDLLQFFKERVQTQTFVSLTEYFKYFTSILQSDPVFADEKLKLQKLLLRRTQINADLKINDVYELFYQNLKQNEFFDANYHFTKCTNGAEVFKIIQVEGNEKQITEKLYEIYVHAKIQNGRVNGIEEIIACWEGK
ncbi:Conserved_hypothetical protein [Hexamita inflata]|uniref:Uncharacterized protein n=1 Tax=Hexamita inflata TaxID=28002 RepID=A0AA86TXQ5_9EUKA|nr:Conserved hypothetical protein [Hexamita inflata]